MQKIAVVIANLGGPDKPEAIQPFLFNLFNDPNIIDLPALPRKLLAWLVSTTRAPKVKPLYENMGGGSPIQINTLAQAESLQAQLAVHGEYKVFTCQRYWHPMVDEVVREVKAWGATHLVLLPLYPQFSTTTTASWLRVWEIAAQQQGLKISTSIPCCFPDAPGFIEAQAELIRPFLQKAKEYGKPRILFSAHGLPEKIVEEKGDPYPIQVQRTAALLAATLGEPQLDWLVTYQSRVGPLEWIKPYTEGEIRRAAAEKTPLIVVPLAFVSEHLETLVELDIEYGHLAHDLGIPYYGRVPTVSLAQPFINAVRDLVLDAVAKLPEVAEAPVVLPPGGQRICPAHCHSCPNKLAVA